MKKCKYCTEENQESIVNTWWRLGGGEGGLWVKPNGYKWNESHSSEYPLILMAIDYGETLHAKIKYCPMCGRKL